MGKCLIFKMNIKEIIQKVESSDEFKKWKTQNEDFFLIHAFSMFEKISDIEWQLGYYNKDKDKIVVFFLSESIKMSQESDVLKTNKEITELNLNDIKIHWEDAYDECKKISREKYSSELPFKYMLLLQNIDSNLVWNITIVMKSFKTLNIQINSATREIIKDNLAPLFDAPL